MLLKFFFRKIFRRSVSSFWHAFATVYGFSIFVLLGEQYSWLFLIVGVLFLRLNLFAILLGAMVPFVFPKIVSLLSGSEGWAYTGIFCAINLSLFILSWLLFLKKSENHDFGGRPFIFMDPTGIRWSLWSRTIATFMIIAILISTVLVFNLMQIPGLSKSNAGGLAIPFMFNAGQAAGLSATEDTKELYAYLSPDDPESIQSFKEHVSSIKTVAPLWFNISGDGSFENKADPSIVAIAQKNHIDVMPVLTESSAGWNDPNMMAILADKTTRSRYVLNLVVQVAKYHANGLIVDFRKIPEKPQTQALYAQFLHDLSAMFQPFSLKLAVTIYPQLKELNVKNAQPFVDRFIVVANGIGQDQLAGLNIPSEKLIFRVENYGVEGDKGIPFADVMGLSSDYHVPIQWGDKGYPGLHYTEENTVHWISFYDAATLYNQIHDTLRFKPKGYALFRLGTEDPSSWNVFDHLFEQKQLRLTQIIPSDHVRLIGEGEVMKIHSKAQIGKRDLQLGSDGRIIDERYIQQPFPFEVQRMGNTAERIVTLTFNDGPDPLFTKQILDILTKYHVPATFFVIGKNASMNQDLVKRIVKEGHEIGNETFSNSPITDPWRLELELNANQRLIEGITGYSMRLFHQPPNLTVDPNSDKFNQMMRTVHDMGYAMVNENIDPRDTEHPAPAPEEIAKRIIQSIHNGHVISLHDGGEERANTVKALPIIIETLQSQGYRFVTLHELMGKTSQQVMPVVSTKNEWLNERLAFLAAPLIQQFFMVVFYASILLGILRLTLLCIFSYQQRKKRRIIRTEDLPFVSVILAAYNEEKIIKKTLEAILESTHKKYEVIVVNDGSTDGTSKTVREMCQRDPRIRLIDQGNAGKSTAINRAFKEAQGSVVISIDADTQMLPQAIEWLARPFIDPKVAAVSGNVKVGNIKNRLTMWQHMEYVSSFNLDRRAFSLLKCVPVVPGALGAWRKEAIEQIGYFPHDTLAEDTDVTVTLIRDGYHIHYEERALAFTEAPDNLKDFLKQRFRWVYGTLQCLWKHRHTLFRKRYGKVGLLVFPYMWLFQFIFQLFVPFADLYSLVSFFGNGARSILYYYLTFLAIDLFTCCFAFRLEKESLKPMWGFFYQRFVYRYMISYIIYRSIIQAIRGKRMGWNKLQRKGSVKIPTES